MWTLIKKKIVVLIEFFSLFFYIFCATRALSATTTENTLNWVEVSQGNFSTQIMFDFTQPVSFTKKLNKEKFRLKLTFPGMDLGRFKHTYVMNQLTKLKRLGLIEHTAIVEKDTPIKRVILALDFSLEKQLDKHHKRHVVAPKNKLLIKWATIEKPNRLIIDIFTKQKLNELKKQDTILLQAHNNSVVSDITQRFSYPKNTTSRKDIRIAIDAGHGGNQPGTQHFGLQEKTLALDIAQRVRKYLKQLGLNAILTRNTDATLSLLERSELAAQLKANLFVSIHVNATGKNDPSENGIETFYLDNRFFFPPDKKNGFILMNLPKHLDFPAKVNNAMRKNLQASRTLASTLQNTLIQTLQKQKINVTNRGIKTDGFRVLLRSGVPAALVEVGFLTNKQEATRLAQEQYRSHLAQGISLGIEKYLVSQQ